jgi:septum site-determining protein MinC
MANPFNDEEGYGDSADTPLAPTAATADAAHTPAARRTDDRNNVITARGTSEGLVLRIDGRVETDDLIDSTREFLDSRRSFLSGNDVAFEWIGKRPDELVVQNLIAILNKDYAVSVRASKQKSVTTPKKPVEESSLRTEPLATDPLSGADTPFETKTASRRDAPQKETSTLAVFGGGKNTPLPTQTLTRKNGSAAERGVSLFDGIESLDSRASVANPMAWDEPDTRIIYGTLRSGQKIETEHSIVVFGDVNSGAEVIAGGDIVILGTLRGIAHAGAYDESGGGRVIFSLNLRPTQLRIGLVISRGSGSEEAESTPRGGLPEVARVDGNMIVVEPYQSRTVWVRRRE